MLNIQVITNEWIDIIILDEATNSAKRKSNNDTGTYIYGENILKIDWIKWGKETFYKINDNYYNCKKSSFEIHLENNEWNDICIFDIRENSIKRKYYESEQGTFRFSNNNLIIDWDNWGQETFYQLNYGKYYTNTTFGNLIKNNSKKHIKQIAIVFPQFHEIPENNEFWGKGFTEWTLLKTIPRIVNGEIIKQPHSDIGYFNLNDFNHRKYMSTLTNKFNIYGFCYYHYWFKNNKVMYEPAENMLKDGEPNKPFMFCWANEQWTRRWDGGNNEILISQEYTDLQGNIDHFYYLLDFFKHKNYIKKFNKPIFIFYRIEEKDIVHIKDIIDLWNKMAIKEGFNGIHFMRFLGPFNNNIKIDEIEGFVDFAPGYFTQTYFNDICCGEEHNSIFENDIYDEKIYLQKNKDIELQVLNKNIHSGLDHFNILSNEERKIRTSKFFIYDGSKLYDKIIESHKICEEQHRGISVNWNNSPRRNFTNTEYDKYPHYYKNVTPTLFGTTLKKLLEKINDTKNKEDDFLFISAWNEWNEQAILEPNNEDGYDYLMNLNKNYLEFYSNPKTKNILNISHLGGGTQKYMDDLKKIFIEYNFIDFEKFNIDTDYSELYKEFNIDIIHINSILFNNLKTNYTYFFNNYFVNCEKYITIHDYQWLFPNNPNLSKDEFFSIKLDQLDDFKNLLLLCAKIIFPSNNIYNNYSKYIDIDKYKNKIFIVEHSDKIINNNFLRIPKIENVINIAYVGNFVKYKGSNIFKNIICKNLKFEHFELKYHIFGSIDTNELKYYHENPDNIFFHNKYNDEEIIDLLYNNNIHGLLHLSLFEESYCYSLTNSINSGLPILYLNRGSFTERLQNNNKCFDTNLDNILPRMNDFLKYIINNENSCDFYKLNNNVQPNKWYLENY